MGFGTAANGVFIKDRRMQHRFREFANRTFGLADIDIDIDIGSTPIGKRQQVAEHFQRQPKAAGTD